MLCAIFNQLRYQQLYTFAVAIDELYQIGLPFSLYVQHRPADDALKGINFSRQTNVFCDYQKRSDFDDSEYDGQDADDDEYERYKRSLVSQLFHLCF